MLRIKISCPLFDAKFVEFDGHPLAEFFALQGHILCLGRGQNAHALVISQLPKPAVAHGLWLEALGHPVRRYGGLKKRLRSELLRIAQESRASAKNDGAPPRRTLSPGTRLLRDWHGRSHSVEVTDAGFLWNGRTYRSLSVITREITGSHRNAPVRASIYQGD
jgi:hypothetical protein